MAETPFKPLKSDAADLAQIGIPIVCVGSPWSGVRLLTRLIQRHAPKAMVKTKIGEFAGNAAIDAGRLATGADRHTPRETFLTQVRRADRPIVRLYQSADMPNLPHHHRALVGGIVARGQTVGVVRDGVETIFRMYVQGRIDEDPRADRSFSEFIRQRDDKDHSRPKAWSQLVKSWKRLYPDMLWVTYSDLIRRPDKVIGSIAKRNRLELKLKKGELRPPILPPHTPARMDDTPYSSINDALGEADLAYFEREAGSLFQVMRSK